MSEIVQQHIECPCGKSSDAYCLYSDGHGHCFSCGDTFQAKGENAIDTSYEMKHCPIRGVSLKTMKRYNVLSKFVEGSEEPFEIGFIYPNGAVKIRSLTEKKFYSAGDMKQDHLFGRNCFESGGKVLYITEGEFDALSVNEVTNAPAVSVRGSSSAKLDCKKEYDWINSFDKIVLAFDSDTVGQKAAREVASLFDFHKVYSVKFERYKDANEYLQNNSVDDLMSALASAKKYTPDNILSSFPDIKDALKGSKEDMIGTYPFAGLQDALHGLHRGEVVVAKGDEGIGKTELFRAMESHLLKESQENRIGILHLEEDKATTIRGIANYSAEYPFLHPDNVDDVEGIFKAYSNAVGGDDERIFIYESFDVEDDTVVLDNIRFLVSACQCNFIFLDHISWLATGIGDSEDVRKKLDRISQKLKLLAKELGFCLIMISHTNDEGKTRDSRNITKVANTVIHMSRDKVSPVENIRLQTKFVVEKGRIAGSQTGPAGWGMYDRETLMLRDGEY